MAFEEWQKDFRKWLEECCDSAGKKARNEVTSQEARRRLENRIKETVAAKLGGFGKGIVRRFRRSLSEKDMRAALRDVVGHFLADHTASIARKYVDALAAITVEVEDRLAAAESAVLPKLQFEEVFHFVHPTRKGLLLTDAMRGKLADSVKSVHSPALFPRPSGFDVVTPLFPLLAVFSGSGQKRVPIEKECHELTKALMKEMADLVSNRYRQAGYESLWHGPPPGKSFFGEHFEGLERITANLIRKRKHRTIPRDCVSDILQSLPEASESIRDELTGLLNMLPQVDEGASVLAIVGPVSAGKSTLTNLLFGAEVIEECVAEHTTPCPILIRHGSRAYLKAFTNENTEPFLKTELEVCREVPAETDWKDWLYRIVVDRKPVCGNYQDSFWGELRGVNSLQRIEITYPIGWLPERAVIVDLPGTEVHVPAGEGSNSSREVRLSRLSQSWLDRSDAAVFIFNVDQTRRGGTHRFISDFRKFGRPTAVAISHTDELAYWEEPLKAKTPEEGREKLTKRTISFLRDQGIGDIDTESLFLAAGRLKRDRWVDDDEGLRRTQELALAGTLHLAFWMLSNLHEDSSREPRQLAHDKTILEKVANIVAATDAEGGTANPTRAELIENVRKKVSQNLCLLMN